MPLTQQQVAEIARDQEATNRAAIGRRLATPAEMDRIHSRLAREVRRLGGEIEAFLVCPHAPDDECDCRKPAPGLLFQARDRYGVDLDSAVIIGDWEADPEAARSAGYTSILIRNDRNGHEPISGADHMVKDISAAVDLILAGNGSLRNRG